jgi:hypothetical protein
VLLELHENAFSISGTLLPSNTLPCYNIICNVFVCRSRGGDGRVIDFANEGRDTSNRGT